MSKESARKTVNGWMVLALLMAAEALLVLSLVSVIIPYYNTHRHPSPWPVLAWIFVTMVIFVPWVGFFSLQPNQAAVLMLFGAYKGTSRHAGLQWANPFFRKRKISLRVRNLNMEKLKVNDQRGNPIEIAAVVVWSVQDSAQACFDVDNYETYVSTQSESALRHLASGYPYDSTHESEISLRGATDEVSLALQTQLDERLKKAGVHVEEARLSHLAYAPEIAGAMLRRQQAEAVVAARFRIVEGAVGMVEAALQRLEEHKTIELDDERKAAMISNLLVVLCGEQSVHPVVNTGTLYT